jgi:hypothetical protein
MGKFFLPILLVLFTLSVSTDWFYFLSFALSIIVLLKLMLKLGKGIALMESMALYSCIIYLLIPSLGYSVYTKDNALAVIWKKTMPVGEVAYYSFILPAITAYLVGLFWLINVRNRPDEGDNLLLIIQKIRNQLQENGKIGIRLVVTGLISFVIKKYLPAALAFVGHVCYLLVFVGILYVYFQPRFKGKILIYLIVGAFIAWDALNTGMFTVLVYMGLTIASFFVAGKKIPFSYKVLGLITIVFSVLILQLVKGTYRKKTWKEDYGGSRVELFQNLAVQQTQKVDMIFSDKVFFPVYLRLNQGWMTSLVMKRIPDKQPYDNGESILKAIAASFVPRFVWPDKPESGGAYNMQHFAGYKIKGWSTNIGPVGEAYGNFGRVGGILFMFVFGWFIGFVYATVFKLGNKMPLIILWFPVLFFEVMFSMENDTLQAFNSLVKASFVIWVIYKLFPNLFRSIKPVAS